MYLLFEVWQENENGVEELIETTSSHSTAMKIADKALENNDGDVIVYQENEEGDLDEIARLTKD